MKNSNIIWWTIKIFAHNRNHKRWTW